MFMATKGKDYNNTIACKLHRQFAHPTPKTLIKIINNAGIKDKKLEKEVDNISEKMYNMHQIQKTF